MKKSNFLCLVLIPLLFIICVQLCLAEPRTRELFTSIESVEGLVYTNTSKSNRGYVELSLSQGHPSDKIVIFYNSQPVLNFTEKTVILPIDCDGVFQIKNGSDMGVIVTAKARNVKEINVINSVIPKGIHALCSVRI